MVDTILTYQKQDPVPKRYRDNVAVVNAVHSGALTTVENIPAIGCDSIIAGKLKAPLPVVDVLGVPITDETRQSDFNSGACMFCHKTGHIHGVDCADWLEHMLQNGFFESG